MAVLVSFEIGVAHADPADGVGSPHPALIRAVDPSGRWVVLCQAREDTTGDGAILVYVDQHGRPVGDSMQTYLVQGRGVGEAIDDYVGRDPTGRHLVFVRKGKLVLLDAETQTEVDLSARGALVWDADPAFGPHSAAHFDDAGKSVLYVRMTSGGADAVVRDLRSGDERRVALGKGLPRRVLLGSHGEWIVAYMVERDTDGNGKLELLRRLTNRAPRRCRGEVSAYTKFGWTGDSADTYVGGPGESRVHPPGDKLVGIGGNLLIRRTADNRLTVTGSRELRKAIGLVAKGTRLLAIAEKRNSLLLWTPGGTEKPTYVIQSSTSSHVIAHGTPTRFPRVTLRALGPWSVIEQLDGSLLCVNLSDLTTRRIVGSLVASWTDRLLIRTDRGLSRVDLSSGNTTRLALGARTNVLRVSPSERFVATEGHLLDLGSDEDPREFHGHVLAISDAGTLLTGADLGGYLTKGPLTWVKVGD